MHTLARFPAREARLKRQVGNRAFTLIELLTVIAIIAILAGITFGVVKGVNERAAVGQAKAELAVLAQALEAYKLQYGDYPQTGGQAAAAISPTATIANTNAQAYFFSALAGGVGPKLSTYAGRSFVEMSKFALETAAMPPATGGVVANSFLDPWGRRYMYFYKNKDAAANWRSPSYVLYSAGPNGTDGEGTSSDPASTSTLRFKTIGVLNNATREMANNVDNIWANK